ncbi:phytochelatin synthase family protein [Cysteiniphilum halobium]|uniref:phytochelatin synthase family protein n=1 Tax=Cysteiniphilum halobium TaxID=2219059 RepID=UPI003F82B3D2
MKKVTLLPATLLSILAINSFAILPVPSDVISFYSPKGQQLLNSASNNNKAEVYKLLGYFTTEKGTEYCAPASITMALNSLGLTPDIAPAHKPYVMYTQNNLFYNKEALDKYELSPPLIMRGGLTLSQAEELVKSQRGAHATKIFGNTIKSADELRKILLANYHSGKYILLNFDRASIDEVGSGHFSPLAAYNSDSDKWLLLDVARYKYPPVWVTTEQVYKSMQDKDSTSHKPRGLLIVS